MGYGPNLIINNGRRKMRNPSYRTNLFDNISNMCWYNGDYKIAPFASCLPTQEENKNSTAPPFDITQTGKSSI